MQHDGLLAGWGAELGWWWRNDARISNFRSKMDEKSKFSLVLVQTFQKLQIIS